MADDVDVQDSAATENQLPSMYEPDEPETPDIEAELDTDTDDAKGEETPAAEPESEAKPEDEPKGHNRDKAIQQMQQRQATFERQTREQIDGVQNTLKELLDTIKAQGGKATPAQKAEVEEVKDELDELLEGLDKAEDDEILTAAQFKSAMKALKSQMAKADEPETVRQLREEMNQLKAQREQAAAEQQFYASFDSENPELAGKGRDLVAKANQQIDKDFPGLQGEARQGALNVIWKQVVAEAKAGSAKPKTPTVPSASTKPPKSTAGTQTVSPGASAARPAGTSRGKPSKPPMYVPD